MESSALLFFLELFLISDAVYLVECFSGLGVTSYELFFSSCIKTGELSTANAMK